MGERTANRKPELAAAADSRRLELLKLEASWLVVGVSWRVGTSVACRVDTDG